MRSRDQFYSNRVAVEAASNSLHYCRLMDPPGGIRPTNVAIFRHKFLDGLTAPSVDTA